MNFQTLTKGQHIVSLPMTQMSHPLHYGATEKHRQVKRWLEENTTDAFHVFAHEGDHLLDFHSLYDGRPGTITESDVFDCQFWTQHLVANCGDVEHVTMKFAFSDPNDATLFKLTWC